MTGRRGSFRRLALHTAVLVLCVAAGPVAAVQDGRALTGIVTVEGSIPPPQQVVVNRDTDVCGSTIAIQPVTVSMPSRGLLQAVVSVSGLPARSAEPRQVTVPIKNRMCTFMPRISAMQVGDVIEIGNDDPILHNTHIRNDTRTILNVAMVPSGRIIQKPIKEPGALKLQCDAHKFMRGYVMAFGHPYFAITDEVGRFRITGLPPGVGRITVWHETLGALQQEVVIPAEGEVSVRFVYHLSPNP